MTLVLAPDFLSLHVYGASSRVASFLLQRQRDATRHMGSKDKNLYLDNEKKVLNNGETKMQTFFPTRNALGWRKQIERKIQ